MTRGRSGAQITADKAPASGAAALVELTFDSGVLRLAVAHWPVVVGADTYTATGGALSVKQHDEAVDAVQGVDIALAGIDAGIKALVFAEPYQGRLVRLLEQRYDDAQAQVGSAHAYYIGRIRAMTCTEDPKNHSVTVTVNTEHFDAEYEEATDLRNTDAEQRRRYPTDLGCEYLASLVDRVIQRKPGVPT